MHSKQLDRASRKVRVVANILGFSGPEANFQPNSSVDWISVNRENSEGVTISFGDQSSSRYLVDYCYKEDEDNEMIYSKEVKPLVSAAFEGLNSTVIAHGARGSGKTHVIQGTAERPGLAVLAITEFLSMAENNGKSIAVSFYEVDHQERSMDLSNPEKPPILVLEDRGRIQFKGLTQIPVKSITEFQNVYSSACFAMKGAPKKGGCERLHRSHMGLIVHVFSRNGTVESLVSKMNFVDLAGYEDARKKSSDDSCFTEINKINKSIYALMNVCHAFSTNESRVPYRESKLTRMLQDSFGRTSKILLISCLNPSFCQDTIYMVSLASRSCHWIHRASLDSTKKSASSAKQIVNSQKKPIPKSVSGTVKKLHGSSKLLEKKSVVAKKSAVKGRKLFDEASNSTTKAEKETSCVHVTQISMSLLDNSLSESGNHVILNSGVERDDCSLSVNSEVDLNPFTDQGTWSAAEDYQKEQTPFVNNYSEALATIIIKGDHNDINKENNCSRTIGDSSPPISYQLRDLSNSLRMLCSSTTSCMPEKEHTPSCIQVPVKESIPLDIEPKTPTIEKNMSVNRWDVMNPKSPWETFSMRSSGMKNSLVQEYLKFLNTADREELKKLKGIGEKRATFILKLREESPEPFKSLDDLKGIGLSAKRIKGIVKKEVGELFSVL
ncbi:hypothetical protein VNO78_32836 [Psophocarpus tetragonolobus]|uniref:Kinesin motor domain-containing protein n=1 Tax=Psophocarpus tetragonolobus TaxID=3891 RepID=A0AAN9RS53_PSOTE